jgi:hypothetical protein
LELFEVKADSLFHDFSSEEIIDLFQEAGSLPVANLVENINSIISMVD